MLSKFYPPGENRQYLKLNLSISGTTNNYSYEDKLACLGAMVRSAAIASLNGLTFKLNKKYTNIPPRKLTSKQTMLRHLEPWLPDFIRLSDIRNNEDYEMNTFHPTITIYLSIKVNTFHSPTTIYLSIKVNTFHPLITSYLSIKGNYSYNEELACLGAVVRYADKTYMKANGFLDYINGLNTTYTQSPQDGICQ